MHLISCPECNRRVPETAPRCPHCLCRIPTATGKQKSWVRKIPGGWWGFIASILVMAVIFGTVARSCSASQQSTKVYDDFKKQAEEALKKQLQKGDRLDEFKKK